MEINPDGVGSAELENWDCVHGGLKWMVDLQTKAVEGRGDMVEVVEVMNQSPGE